MGVETGKFFRLKKSIYGLKQAAFVWFKLLSSVLRELGYSPVDASECVWDYGAKDGKALFAVHVDDYVHAFSNSTLDDRLVNKFKELWGVSGVGPLRWHLGMEIDYIAGKYVTITQRTYVEKVLKRFGYEKMKPASTPMDSSFVMSTNFAPAEALNDDERKMYLEILGSLIYAAIMTRPDIANAVAQLGRSMSNPSKSHLGAAKRVLRYLAGTVDRGLKYENKEWNAPGMDRAVQPCVALGYGDSDWAGDVDSRTSMGGSMTFLAGGLICWRAALQKIQRLSSGEAEYVNLSDCCRDIIYVRNVLAQVNIFKQTEPTPLFSDSTAAISIAQKKGVNHRTKHIALRDHFVRSLVSDDVVDVRKIHTSENPADILTKATRTDIFKTHIDVCVPRVSRN
jgi:hypothetical protein